ncbi:hypothetical protein DL764_006038 [Monosporascus ibericus]|uniref:Zinc finger CHCC-type domain-containing protein n=1 Tax=Monosporascus ibericus TaxID=155417 RepID=A0A4Q4T665_9PEZI|nr:hypothetical protein DL764_006038 [Monosporascus ibericus]
MFSRVALRKALQLPQRTCAAQRTLTASARLYDAKTPIRKGETTPELKGEEDSLGLAENEERGLSQAPNRKEIWSRSQKPRAVAMSGPRFEQTDFSLQPQSMAAIELIHRQPVRWTHERIVACEGGGGPAGHPRIYINTDKPEIATCGYCGLPFTQKPSLSKQQTPPKLQQDKSQKEAMPSSTTTQNIYSFLLLSLLLIAFFPGLFHYLTTLPFSILSFVFAPRITTSSSTPSAAIPTDATTPPPPNNSGNNMSWFQKQFTLPARSRGSYLVTEHVVGQLPELREYRVGLLNLFVQHTSCALSLNENWDDDVRADMSDALDRIAPAEGPRGEELYRHSAEGPDDMPAHIKSALIGASVTIPIKDGKLATGTWQGIWYLEFRAMKHTRKVVATIQGEKA